MREPRPTRARFKTAEIIGGKLELTGPWERWSRRDVVISVFPDDIKHVRAALDALEAAEEDFQIDRKVQEANAKREKQANREKRIVRKKFKEENIEYAGVKLV